MTAAELSQALFRQLVSNPNARMDEYELSCLITVRRVLARLDRLPAVPASPPLDWTLCIDGVQYLKVRLSAEDAQAWGKTIAKQFPQAKITIVTA